MKYNLPSVDADRYPEEVIAKMLDTKTKTKIIIKSTPSSRHSIFYKLCQETTESRRDKMRKL